MDARSALFRSKKIYDIKGTDDIFVEAVRENILYHAGRCPFYADLLKRESFRTECLKTGRDCASIPVIPSAFFKRHEILSVPHGDVCIHATSSGTQGQKSHVDLDDETLKLGTRMVVNCFSYHHLISVLPVHYIMLGYEPDGSNDMGAIKTAMGVTRFAPAIGRTFVLRKTSGGYVPDWFGVFDTLKRCHKLRIPVRFVGFPAFLYRLLTMLQKENVAFRLNRRSHVLLGGGWKQFAGEAIRKPTLYAMVQETLGIPPENCRDFYSAVEHSIAYAECKNHHLHVPVWSRVFIRDVKTLSPLGFGRPGLLSFVTPLVTSMPLTSVLMSDIATLFDGKTCGCGIETPYFEVLGRTSAGKMRNCALAADETLGAQP